MLANRGRRQPADDFTNACSASAGQRYNPTDVDELTTEPKRKKPRIANRIAMGSIPLVRLLIRLFWFTYRIEIAGVENVASLIADRKPFIPCYWHGRQFIGVWTMLQLQKQGLKTGFLVSPSRDGELAARLLVSLDVYIMRGSATRTGAEAMRQLMAAIRKEGISPIMTPDGPKGPIYEFKPGTVAVAQLTRTPMVPIAWHARKGWTFNSWDRFELPKPFTRIKVVIGEPVEMPKRLSQDKIAGQCRALEDLLNQLQASVTADSV